MSSSIESARRGRSRARTPDSEGFVEREGERLHFEVHGTGAETIFLLPTWSILHSRHWKMQVPYLARRFRVLTMDGLGNGRSDRCRDPRRYGAGEFADDCLAVMDATGTEQAVMVSLSRGAQFQLELAGLAPERVLGAAFIAPQFPYSVSHQSVLTHRHARLLFQHPAPIYRWWGRMNATHWRRDYRVFADWFISRCFSEPHSTKGVEDGVGWALETDPETLIATALVPWHGRRALRKLARGLDCPVLVIHGTHDKITPPRDGRALARLSGARIEMVPGAGHLPHVRKPVQVNLALCGFAEEVFGYPSGIVRSSSPI